MHKAFLLTCGLLVGCQSNTAPHAAAAAGDTLVFACEGERTLVLHRAKAWQHSLERVMVSFPELGRRELERVDVRTGLRYEADQVAFWGEGDQADVLEGEAFYHCTLNATASHWEHATLMGVQFRAQGNEPGWMVEFEPMTDELRVQSDYGQTRVTVPLVVAEVDAEPGQRRYRSESELGAIDLLIEDTLCHDTMSGEQFERTVTLQVGETLLYGCGRRLY